MFKFWPNTELRDAWRTYLDTSAEGNAVNLLTLSICLRILEQTVQQFVVRQAEKAEKASKKVANQLNKESGTKKPAAAGQAGGSRGQAARSRGDFVKCFSSSESEEEESEEEVDEAQEEESGSRNPRSRAERSKRGVKKARSPSESESEAEEGDASGDEDSREWDEYCFVC